MGRIHEQVTAYDEKEYLTYKVPVVIGHTGYDLPQAEKKEKALRNIRLLEQELKNWAGMPEHMPMNWSRMQSIRNRKRQHMPKMR